MIELPLTDEQLEEVREGIAAGDLHLTMGDPEDPSVPWFDLWAEPEEEGSRWVICVRIEDREMSKVVEGHDVEDEVVRAFGYALGMNITIH